MFLFSCQEEEKVREKLDAGELKPNQLREIVYKHFEKFNFKKASYIYSEKKVVLNFDFPAVVDENVYNEMKEFQEKLGWKVEISSKVNINAASEVIKEFFQQENVNKISYRLEKNEVLVILNSLVNIEEGKLKEFRDITGMDIFIRKAGDSNPNSAADKVSAKTHNRHCIMEQNRALQFIDEFFNGEEFRPYRKSVKSCLDKKYIELSFISPLIGKKYEKAIKKIADSIGWNISVSESANQNKITEIAVKLCKRENIELRKNPSFNSFDLSVELKLKENYLENSGGKLNAIKNEFEYKTGCLLKW